jgi:ribonuclease PH
LISSLNLQEYPRLIIYIKVCVLRDDGAMLSVALNAASIALLDSGVLCFIILFLYDVSHFMFYVMLRVMLLVILFLSFCRFSLSFFYFVYVVSFIFTNVVSVTLYFTLSCLILSCIFYFICYIVAIIFSVYDRTAF